MILSLGLGEPNYVPDSLLGHAQDYADTNSLPFLQCYARDLLQWEIICFFSVYQDEWCSLDQIAEELEYLPGALARGLGDLAETKLLEERVLVTGPIYRLTEDKELHRAAVRTGLKWGRMPAYAD